MLLPANVKDLTYEELIEALIEKEGYTKEAATYIAGKVKGKIKDNNIVQ